MTDSEKLIKLAEWLDTQQPREGSFAGDEVQQDLRRIASSIDHYKGLHQQGNAIITELQAQLSSKEQECERLKAELKTTEEALADKDRKLYNNDLASLRKRCEDLEAVVRELIDVANPNDIDAFEPLKKACKLLSQ